MVKCWTWGRSRLRDGTRGVGLQTVPLAGEGGVERRSLGGGGGGVFAKCRYKNGEIRKRLIMDNTLFSHRMDMRFGTHAQIVPSAQLRISDS